MPDRKSPFFSKLHVRLRNTAHSHSRFLKLPRSSCSVAFLLVDGPLDPAQVSTGFLAGHFQLPTREWRQLGSFLLILQLQPSPDYQFQCFPWVQFNYKHIFIGSQQSTLSPGGSSELHTNRNCKLLDFYLDPLIMLLPLDTWEKPLSPSNTTRRKKHSSATGSFTNYAKTVGGGEKTERNGWWVSGMAGESKWLGNQMIQFKAEFHHILVYSLGQINLLKCQLRFCKYRYYVPLGIRIKHG